MLNIFHYDFIIRGLEAGIIIAVVAPLIGTFLVLRRYSLIADTLAHVSLAGVAIGLLFNFNPILTAIVVTALSSLGIEKLRLSKRIYGESALALFLSGSLALAVVIIGIAHGFNVDLFSYLFGSIVTVKQSDVIMIGTVGTLVLVLIFLFFKELVFVTLDEEAAQVNGIPVNFINILLILLSSLTIALSIPIIGVLLISALVVIPVLTALQFKMGFKETVFISIIVSILAVLLGIFISFYFNLATGGTIVLIALIMFFFAIIMRR